MKFVKSCPRFIEKILIGLIKQKKHKWLFAGVYKVLGYKKRKGGIYYSTELVENQNDLIGRVIVYHERKGRSSYLIGLPDGGGFYVSAITEKKLFVREFPGYNSVIIDYRTLKLIIDNQIESWKGALSNIKGVYLITDTSIGKLYVGSATGEDGIWQRWETYVTNGHGENEKLIQLLKEDPEHQYHFQYSILEISDSKEYMEEREIHWKKIFKSIRYGLNAN